VSGGMSKHKGKQW